MKVIHWFRRDLRLQDNTALMAACAEAAGAVIPVFILDTRLLAGAGVAPVRLQFMLESLRDLDANLRKSGSRLILRKGLPEVELPKLAKEFGANAVYFNRDVTPRAIARDGRVASALNEAGVDCKSFKDAVVFEGAEMLTKDGHPYTVFTPFKRNWLAKWDGLNGGAPIKNLPNFSPQPLLLPAGVSLPLPTLKELGVTATVPGQGGGETQAAALLAKFLADGVHKYGALRDSLTVDGTSRLSPHFRFGTLSPRVAVHSAFAARMEEGNRFSTALKQPENGVDVWVSEVVWREFYMQILQLHPHAYSGNFNRACDALQWGGGNAKKDAELFAAWCDGRTGYPIVDAAMRQLNTTGWMPNRARMIVASFLCKDLLLDWRLGQRYFMQKLVDGDPAANNGGWQWSASTGTDAQPYFRVFNPTLQSEKFDPTGVYIRKYIRELSRCPQEFIHDPTKVPPMIALQTNTASYPKPVVDHAKQKDIMAARFKALK